MKYSVLAVEAFATVWRRRMAWLAVLCGIGAVFSLLYLWLSLREQSVLDVVWTTLLALAVAGMVLFLEGVFLFAPREEGRQAYLTALRRAHRLAPVTLAGAVLLYWLRSFPWPGWALLLYSGLLLALLVPLLRKSAGVGDLLPLWASPAFWAAHFVWLAAALYLPWMLIWWAPGLPGLGLQATSFALRLLGAGLAFTGLTLAYCAFLEGLAAPSTDPGGQAAAEPAE